MNQTDPEDAAVERQLPRPRWKQNVWPNGILEDVVQLTDRSVTVTLLGEVAPGNQHQHTSKHSSPRLWALLVGLDAGLRPWLIRGDVGFGNEPVTREAERRHQPYLFKLRLTKGVKRAAAIDGHRHVRSASTRARCVVGGSRCGDTGSSPQAATSHPCPASAHRHSANPARPSPARPPGAD
jgi:hypothetical protein